MFIRLFTNMVQELMEQCIQNLYDGLENGKYGLDYLKELDQKLGTVFPNN
jgi:hypothetical protein